MPSKSKLDQTRSDLVGDISFDINNNLDVDYKFSYDRDLNHSNYNSLGVNFKVNNFVTGFDYVAESKEFGNTETIKNNSKLNFTEEHSLSFNTAKDLKNDFTEYVNLIYQYETDCLSASIEYNKKFYRDGNLVPVKNLQFVIRFIPFTEIRGSAGSAFTK